MQQAVDQKGGCDKDLFNIEETHTGKRKGMTQMNSDDWMINGYIQGSIQVLIPDQVSYYLWYEDPENPAGVTLLVGEEASYDLEYESWIRFLNEIGISAGEEEDFRQRLAARFKELGMAAIEAKLMIASGQFDSVSFSS